MPLYELKAKIDQIVTKEVELIVEAGSEEEAADEAHRALCTYPHGVEAEKVRRIIPVKSHYWIPKSIDIIRSKQIGGEAA